VIQVVLGELTGVGAEAVLRPVGGDLDAVTPLSRRVGLEAGEGVRRRLEATGELPVGGAVVTPGGGLSATFLIHVVIQSREEPSSPETVRRALQNGLRQATDWGVQRLALPPLGTGAGHLDAEASAAVMVPVIAAHLAGAPLPREVTLVVGSQYEEQAFRGEVERLGQERGG